ncbi:hypothetical protein E2C01_039420 [Portunus trituberculatus]|uniref:Secreted protein n=1 Tax=Portunus trituberculatus TaxID=210409 RepID=A0A5B7FMZ6_PORTR|nr:hypothetical protein [Portunus trituberculatus]
MRNLARRTVLAAAFAALVSHFTISNEAASRGGAFYHCRSSALHSPSASVIAFSEDQFVRGAIPGLLFSMFGNPTRELSKYCCHGVRGT